jgi:hypothetical protein
MRILIVSYRPAPGEFDTVVSLLREQNQRVRHLGVTYAQPPLLARSAAGEITYVASFADGHDVDRCWEDPAFQDIDARLATVAEMIPVRALHEASASYMDLEGVEPTARSAELATEPAPRVEHADTTNR